MTRRHARAVRVAILFTAVALTACTDQKVGADRTPKEALSSKSLTPVAPRGLTATLVDFANASGANSQRIVGAMIAFGNASWFFKLAGRDAPGAQAWPAFLELLQTIKPATSVP